jgi:hypothetical protein
MLLSTYSHPDIVFVAAMKKKIAKLLSSHPL